MSSQWSLLKKRGFGIGLVMIVSGITTAVSGTEIGLSVAVGAVTMALYIEIVKNK